MGDLTDGSWIWLGERTPSIRPCDGVPGLQGLNPGTLTLNGCTSGIALTNWLLVSAHLWPFFMFILFSKKYWEFMIPLDFHTHFGGSTTVAAIVW